jgi:FkbM family methyltransferase
MSYLEDIFIQNIKKDHIKTIFELGSRDLVDAEKIAHYYDSKVYSFECNPDCLKLCNENYKRFDTSIQEKIVLVEKAVTLEDKAYTFFSIDAEKYTNIGASSLLELDFSNRHASDPDANREPIQKQITVDGIRLETFIRDMKIPSVDLICMDLQGYELNALKSMSEYLHTVKYIITECQVNSTYRGGTSFKEIEFFLANYGFEYTCSNIFDYARPKDTVNKHLEFDCLFTNSLLV